MHKESVRAAEGSTFNILKKIIQNAPRVLIVTFLMCTRFFSAFSAFIEVRPTNTLSECKRWINELANSTALGGAITIPSCRFLAPTCLVVRQAVRRFVHAFLQRPRPHQRRSSVTLLVKRFRIFVKCFLKLKHTKQHRALSGTSGRGTTQPIAVFLMGESPLPAVLEAVQAR